VEICIVLKADWKLNRAGGEERRVKKDEENCKKKKKKREVDSVRLGGANRRFTSQTMFDPYLYAKGHKSHIL